MAFGGKTEELKKGETLTAVIIAEDFNSKLAPLTNDKAKCLLPIANRPVIDYSLDLLRRSGVRETHIYCASNATQVRNYVRNVHGTNVNVLSNDDCHCLGDAMRDLDGKGLLRDHFILMTCGGAVGNVDLNSIMQKHRERCRQDKNTAMTLIHKRSTSGNHLRTADEELFMATNSATGKILHYSQPSDGRKVQLPLDVFGTEQVPVDLCFGVIDTGVAVCSPNVPPLFSDSFDCQSMHEFVKGAIEDDLTDNTLYSHVLNDTGYLTKVSDFATYLSVTKDVLNRWAYPHLPDADLYSYSVGKHLVYKTPTSSLLKGSCLEKEVIVGHDTTVGFNTLVSSSSVGSGCSIGNDVVLKDCLIQNDVKIHDGCNLFHCVVGEGVQVGEGVVVNKKCVFGNDVVVKDRVEIPETTWLVATRCDDGFGDEEEQLPSEFGPRAFVYQPDGDDASEDSDEEKGQQDVNQRTAATLDTMWGRIASYSDNEAEDSSDSDAADSNGSDLIDQIGVGDILLDDDAKFQVFQKEVLESLQRGAKEGIKENNLVLEINSSRHAYAVTAAQVVHAVLLAVLTISQQSSAELSIKQLLVEIKRNVQAFKGILLKYAKNVNSQIDLLKAVETFFHSQQTEALPIVAQVMHHMYDLDLVSETAILKWESRIGTDDDDDDEEVDDEFIAKLREKLKPLIAWLKQADDSTDESD